MTNRSFNAALAALLLLLGLNGCMAVGAGVGAAVLEPVVEGTVKGLVEGLKQPALEPTR